MDISRKISEENIKLLKKLQISLMKDGIKITQRGLIREAIKFSLKDKRVDFIKTLVIKNLRKESV